MPLWRTFRPNSTLVILTWLPLVLIATLHLCGRSLASGIPMGLLGTCGWIACGASLLLLCRPFLLQAGACFLLFFWLGFATGPYLEPPVDHFEHLTRIHAYQGKEVGEVARVNEGLLHYAMLGTMIGADARRIGAEAKLRRIDASQGLIWALLLTTIFATARGLGLSGRWALFASLAALLFFGTNRFAFFNYYSLAPSSTSLLIYWFWIALFFFRTSSHALLGGLAAAAAALPLLLVNHLQETFFLLLAVFVWLIVNLHEWIWPRIRTLGGGKATPGRSPWLCLGYLTLLLGIFFVLPQLDAVEPLLRTVGQDNFDLKHEVIFKWRGIDLMGRVWALRINDTLGFIGVLILLLAAPAFWPGLLPGSAGSKARIFLLAMLPFIGYTVPLFHEAWLARISPFVYYRLCYSSLFWLFLAWFGQAAEQCLLARLPRTSMAAGLRPGLYALALLGLLTLSATRSAPVHGRLDFLRLDPRPWWPAWQAMITELLADDQARPIRTDPVTAMVLKAVFDLDAAPRWREQGRLPEVYNEKDPHTFLKFRALGRKNLFDPRDRRPRAAAEDQICVINLISFPASWVAPETGHWQPNLSDLCGAYRIDGQSGPGLVPLLRERPPTGCRVFLPPSP